MSAAVIISLTRALAELSTLDPFGECQFSPPRDNQFLCPSLPWIRGRFHRRLRADLDPWNLTTNDCDTGALETVVVGERCLKATRSVAFTNQTTIALWYVHVDLTACKNGINGVRDGQHATNIVRSRAGELHFYEWQNGQTEPAQAAINRGARLRFVLV